MKSTLVVGSFLLGGCLVAFGQVSSGSQAPATTPPTFPQSSSQSQSQSGAQGAPDQTSGSQSSAPMTSQSQTSSMSISGCLQAGPSGGYALADKSGKVYQLTGDNSQLSKYVNNEVQISGSQAPSSAASAAPGSSSASSTSGGTAAGTSQNAISVASVQKVSDTCTSKAQPQPR
jgi:hypothetical protein